MKSNQISLRGHFLKDNIIVILFFLIYLIVGLLIYKDYGISFDEDISRMNGFVSLQHLLNKFSVSLELNNTIGTIPNIENYWDNVYGVLFDLPLALIETLFDIKDSRDVYLLRHLITFIIFFLSACCFYNLLNFNFKDKKISLLGVVILILSPRIFGNSFYNSKDIVFLSFVIFATYFCIKALNQKEFRYILLASLFSALCTSIRIIGIYMPFLTILFYYLNYNKNKYKRSTIKFTLYFLPLFFIFLFLFWPYLWNKPITNFIYAFNKLGNFPIDFYVLYLGDVIKAKFVPWHYFFVWFFVTTPILFSTLIIWGTFYVFKNFIINFLSIEFNSKKLLWKNNKEMNEIYILFLFFIPILGSIFFDSTLYNGWRHFYFVYPFLVFLSIIVISKLINDFGSLVKKTLYFFLIIQIGFNINFIVLSHPVQSIYFNKISRWILPSNFYHDYWGIGNKHTLEKLISNEKYSIPIKIATSSFTDLNKIKLILKKDLRDKFIFLGTDKSAADFIFTNYFYVVSPKNNKEFTIPKDYHSIIKFEVDGLIVNEIFEKR